MADNARIEKLKEIFSDADFTAKVLELETPEEVQAARSRRSIRSKTTSFRTPAVKNSTMSNLSRWRAAASRSVRWSAQS